MEIESKRNGTKKVSDAEANNNAEALESLTQELSVMRKDILTAERIAKQSEVIYLNLFIFYTVQISEHGKISKIIFNVILLFLNSSAFAFLLIMFLDLVTFLHGTIRC